MTANDYITSLQAQGRYTFTTAQAMTALGVSAVAAQAALRRLKQRGVIAVPARGFHVIVPPEYRRLGCQPASEFVPELMAYLDAPYYAGLLTAAEIYGAAHHKPQVFQVVTDRNRRPLGAGRIRIVFIAKAGVKETPIQEKTTDLATSESPPRKRPRSISSPTSLTPAGSTTRRPCSPSSPKSFGPKSSRAWPGLRCR